MGHEADVTEAQTAFGRREGEQAITLPAHTDAGLYFIGRIRTPWSERGQCPKNNIGASETVTVEVDALYAAGVAGLETLSHVWVLYFMDRAPRDLIVQNPRHAQSPRGTFALRSPARPNPVAMVCVQLIDITHRDDGSAALRVIGLDRLDGTPLIDIKPYYASTDSRPEATNR